MRGLRGPCFRHDEPMTPEEFHAARKALGLTQRELATLLGRTYQMISRYENGHSPIPEVVRLALTWLADRGK